MDLGKVSNPSHLAALQKAIKVAGSRQERTVVMLPGGRTRPAYHYNGYAYLVPDPANGRINVEVDPWPWKGLVVDQLTPESQAKVTDRVATGIRVRCRLSVTDGNPRRPGEFPQPHVMLWDPWDELLLR